MRRIVSILIALVMVFSLGISAYAAEGGSITIRNAKDGQTYKAFKLFDATVDGDAINYTGEIPESLKAYFTADDAGNIKLANDASELSTEAIAAMKAWAEAQDQNNPAGQATGANGTAVISNLEYGYYVVTTTTGTVVTIDSVNKDVSVSDKNDTPDINKEVQEDSTQAWGSENTAQIGQVVNYKTTVSAKKGAINYVVEDKMTAGLTFNNDVVVKVGETTLTLGTDYTVETWAVSEDREEPAQDFASGFKVVFKNTYLDTITTDTEIVITYSATLNNAAVIADLTNDNDTRLVYGRDSNNSTEWKETKTKTFKFDLVKTKNDATLLPGAKFALYDVQTGGSAIALVKVSDNEYRIATTEDSATVTEIEVTGGQVVIKGLDADSATKYYLEETKAPDGYNKLSERVVVDMTEGKNLDATIEAGKWTAGGVRVINQGGTEFPSTGGIGTTLFYVIGAFLAIAAGVMLVVRRRSGATK